MLEISSLLQEYEKRHAPKFHPIGGTERMSHWYKLTIYSDGSGFVEDSVGEGTKLFDFTSYKELEEELMK